MIILYFLIAIFIGWIWIDYYRLIEIYDVTNLKYILLTFFLGGASVLVVIGFDKVLHGVSFELSNNLVSDFLYSIFRIGMIEEIAKTIPLVIMYLLFKKQFNEPIDYVALISISALGFSAVENVMYFDKHGASVINARAAVSSVGHMLHSSFIAYGIIIVKFKHQKNWAVTLAGFLFLAALSHGFYDFWLIHEETKSGGWIITIFYFFLMISIFATILNNAVNNSSFFSYKKVIDSDKVVNRLLSYYAIVFLIQIVLLTIKENFIYALSSFMGSLFTSGFIIIIAVTRLSRFKLIKDRWEEIKVELPFRLISNDNSDGSLSTLFRIRIKGDSFNESYINAFYEEYFFLLPVSSRSTDIADNQLAYIESKLFLKNDETFYLAKLFRNGNKEQFEQRLLQPKTHEQTMMYDKYPIVAILKIEEETELSDLDLSGKDFEFQEWAYIQPFEENNQINEQH